MNRYIDADLLRENMAELKEHERKYLKTHEVFNTIWDAPTADVVEVVRCGECKYMAPSGRCSQFADDTIRPSASDFCSAGERREDGEIH